MKRALFISKHLLGDGLYTTTAFANWYREHGSEYGEIDFLVLDQFTKPIYDHMGIPVRVITQPDEGKQYDFTHEFNVAQAYPLCGSLHCHVAEAYATLLGCPLQPQSNWGHLRPSYFPDPEEIEPEYCDNVLVSMFSHSCRSRGNPPGPPTTMLPFVRWRPLLEYLRARFPSCPMRFLGAPSDRATDLEISEDEYMTGVPLNRLANIMQRARLVVTVGNGMSHLAGAVDAPTFLLYQACLGLNYILPRGNPNLRFIQVDPATVNPMGILVALKMAIKNMDQTIWSKPKAS